MTKKPSVEQKTTRRATPWHDRFGTLFKLFNMRAVTVSPGFDAAKEMPKGDVLLLLNEEEVWTDEQRQYLPDGVRDDYARHKLLEFKYTESFNEDALEQTFGYNVLYRRSHGLERVEVDSYLLVSMTPNAETLQEFGYKQAEHPGVYRTDIFSAKEVTVIVLNDLRDEPHNAYVKLFASRKNVKRKAIAQLKEIGVFAALTELSEFLYGLARLLFEEENMDLREEERRFPKELIEIGMEMAKAYVVQLPPEERMAGLPAEQRMAGLPPEQRMAGLPPEQRMAGLLPEQRTVGLDTDDLKILLKQIENQLHARELELSGNNTNSKN